MQGGTPDDGLLDLGLAQRRILRTEVEREVSLPSFKLVESGDYTIVDRLLISMRESAAITVRERPVC